MGDGVFVKHVGCDACGSSDAGALYSDGNVHCHSCGNTVFADTQESFADEEPMDKTLFSGEFQSLAKRRISENTCRKYNYRVGSDRGTPIQIANYYDEDKKLVGQKIRKPNKEFSYRGSSKVGLYGQHLFAKGGKQVIITEGEIDALSVAEAFQCKYPVVSLINGANSAYKNIKANLEWVLSFKNVVLWFDADEAGQSAVEAVATLFKPGQVKTVAHTGYKDANELLVAKGTAAVVSASYNAEQIRIDGIVNAKDMWEELSKEQVFETYSYPFPKMEKKFHGLRKGELVTFAAGSGVGKSTIVKEITYHLLMKENKRVGYIALEESNRRSALGFMGMYLKKPLFFEYDKIPIEEKKEAFDAVMSSGNLFFYDHFGSIDEDNLLTKLRLLITQNQVDFIVIDHISIVVSGNNDSDERKAIDSLMTNLRSLAEETQAGFIVVSHLRRPQGDKGHEDGAWVSLSQLRGSGAIAQLSDGVVSVERDMRDEEKGNVVQLRILKNRFAGEVGAADTLEFDKTTGRMVVTENFEGEF